MKDRNWIKDSLVTYHEEIEVLDVFHIKVDFRIDQEVEKDDLKSVTNT